jgi:ArsR family transcriptional regulator
MTAIKKLPDVDPRKVELEAQLLSLLGQSTRLKLLFMLQDGERCACELDPAMPKDQSVISRHLIKMREAGILGWRKEGVSIFYWIEEPRVFEMLELVDDIVRSNAKRKAQEALSVL